MQRSSRPPNAPRYYDEDREAGYVLLCTAKPRANTTLIVDQYDDFLAFRAANDRLQATRN